MPLLGKRKREENNDYDQPVLRLTESNLAALQAVMPRSPIKKTKNPAPEPSFTSDGTSQSKPSIDHILETWNIRIDNLDATVPLEIQQLVADVTKARSDPVTPKSVKVTKLQYSTRRMGELDAIKTLEQYLALKPEIEDGEVGVSRASNLQWKANVIPRPDAESDDKDLQDAMKAVGSPAKPQPDLTIGYTEKTFTSKELLNFRSIFPLLVSDELPYFPYLVYEWKSEKNGGTMYAAQRQAVRDGAAAAHSMCRVLERYGGRASLKVSAVFSMCVSSHLELRIHWRNIGDTTSPTTWDCKVVASALLSDEAAIFRVRSAILNILAWARGTRLQAIQKVLTSTPPRPESDVAEMLTEPETRQEPSPPNTDAPSLTGTDSPARKRPRTGSDASRRCPDGIR